VAALIDAGVALRFVAVGVCCALSSDGTLLLDPTKEEVFFIYIELPFFLSREVCPKAGRCCSRQKR
jgi:hypothetical protein